MGIEFHSRFYAKTPPPISITEYIHRATRYIKCDDAVLIVALMYIDRVVSRNPEFMVCSCNIHRFGFICGCGGGINFSYSLINLYEYNHNRLVFLGIVVADKLYSDEYMSNQDYAAIGGLSLAEINLLEHEFMALIGFDLYISEERYDAYYQKLDAFDRSLKAIHEDQNQEKIDCLSNVIDDRNTDESEEIKEEKID